MFSSTANKGGFFFVCRFGINLVTATNRGFIGLALTTAAYAPAVNPSTLFSQIGFSWDSTQTTMRFTSAAATGANVQTDLGANFPVNVNATNFYEVRMFSPSAGGQTVSWSAQRLNDGAFASGTFSTAASMPALDAPLTAHVHHGNGTTAAAVNIDVQSLYIESDN